MKITKYPQSTFLIESEGKKIIIDPGYVTFGKYPPDHFDQIEAIFITHQHPDHLDKESVERLVKVGVPLYGNHDVASQFEGEDFEVTKVFHGSDFQVAGFKIKPVDLPHFSLLWCESCNQKITPDTITKDKKCSLHPGQEPKKVEGPPNTGYLINDLFFHPGDGLEVKDLQVKTASVPIGGPTVDYTQAWNLINSLNAQVVIPMHYSIPVFGADPNKFADLNISGVRVVILEDQGSLEIS